MTTFTADHIITEAPLLTSVPGLSVNAVPPGPFAPEAFLSTGYDSGTYEDTGSKSEHAVIQWSGCPNYSATQAVDWFTKFHILPRSIILGNLITAQVIPTEIYSAFRDDPHDWLAFVDNVGPGVDIVGEPALPYTVPPQSSVLFDTTIDLDAPPVVDSTLEYQFDVPQTLVVPIQFKLVVLLTPRPERPFSERLEFLTDVMVSITGKEQRYSLRLSPRQIFSLPFLLEDTSSERQFFESLLFDWQGRVFGLPLWYEATELAAAASAGATTLQVQSTADADYRPGGLVLIFSDSVTFDVVNLDEVTSGTVLTLSGQILNDYPAGTEVMPLRTALASSLIGGSRTITGLTSYQITLVVDEAGTDLADITGWPTLGGKVLLDDCNIVLGGQYRESNELRTYQQDGITGLVYQVSEWTRNQHVAGKRWFARGKSGLWRIRKLLHALRGRQVDFRLPTFRPDMTAIGGLVSGSTQLSIANMGYTQYVQGRKPKDGLRVLLRDGTAYARLIVDQEIIDATEELLTVDSAWPDDVSLADIARVEYVELVRFDSDTIEITYLPGAPQVRVFGPVRGMFS